ncbi:MAG: alanyl-tRNA editing protein [Thermoplasmatales archaeon]|jgi:alanyl-tRNA synthetase|nr:alanyl-tRNA editing protein [Thermoplasmatales archaeon]
MTEEIFAFDGYLTEFEAVVSATDGDWVSLDSTAFYPGGGGQAHDTGTLRGKAVEKVERRGDGIWHLCPGHGLEEGDKIWCSVNWDRRYELMKGHTAEHMLFGALNRLVPDMNIVKIDIEYDDKYVIVDRDVDWDIISDAVASVNAAVGEDLSVIRSSMDRDDPELEHIRAKLDRIEGNRISVVEIDGFDIAACGGLHVMETGEIEFVFADRKVSSGKEGYAIHFKVGSAAKKASSDLAYGCLKISEALNSKPSDAEKAAANVLSELNDARSMLKKAGRALVNTAGKKDFEGVTIRYGVLPADTDVLAEAAERWRSEGHIAVLATDSDPSSVILASGDARIDCKKILADALSSVGGRGGGKKEFARGGLTKGADPSDFVKKATDAVQRALSSL